MVLYSYLSSEYFFNSIFFISVKRRSRRAKPSRTLASWSTSTRRRTETTGTTTGGTMAGEAEPFMERIFQRYIFISAAQVPLDIHMYIKFERLGQRAVSWRFLSSV